MLDDRPATGGKLKITKGNNIMQFTVTLDDIYLDAEGELDVELKKHLTRSIVCQIEKNIGAKIEEEISKQVKSHVENVCLKKITAEVSRLIEAGEIIKDGKTIAIPDYVRQQFEKCNSWNSPYDQIKRIAETWGNELKKRYDTAFAVHIVDNMSKNGLLKDEGIKKLLGQ